MLIRALSSSFFAVAFALAGLAMLWSLWTDWKRNGETGRLPSSPRFRMPRFLGGGKADDAGQHRAAAPFSLRKEFPWLLAIFLLFFATRAILLYTALKAQPGWGWEQLLSRWDGPHYLHLAEDGYQNTGDPRFFIVFFPLFSVRLVRAVSWITGGERFLEQPAHQQRVHARRVLRVLPAGAPGRGCGHGLLCPWRCCSAAPTRCSP